VRRVAALLVVLVVLALPVAAGAHPLEGRGVIELPPLQPVPLLAETASEGFELVGHSPLLNRGMNAALAVHGDHAYVGSRTDGWPHRRSGILVVDVSDPASPDVVHEIGAPVAANRGETSRELRIWPEQEVLIVLNHGCSSILHACLGSEVLGVQSTYRFFDISGEHAAQPRLIATYEPSVSGQGTPHEFFLWIDPARPRDRALLFHTTPSASTTAPNLLVTDISDFRSEEFREVRWAADFPAETLPNGEREDRRLHSLTVSNDGTRGYLAFLGAGFLVLDTSEIAAGVPDPRIELVTPPEHRVAWSNPGAHSAVKLWGQDAVLITDEVYGDLATAIAGGTHGCPWGWVRTIDIADEERPELLAEYRLAENEPGYCDDPVGGSPLNTLSTSYSAHNPTVTPSLAFVTWHSAGLEAIDVTDPAAPRRAGTFKPRPLPLVVTEDPALSYGLDKVVMWSFPVIADGLIYVVDLRNGLYILRYTGEHAEEVAEVAFLEGNSNAGDALRFEPVAGLERDREPGAAWASAGPSLPTPAHGPDPAALAPWAAALAIGAALLLARRRPAALHG
jgi:hypothetical protein